MEGGVWSKKMPTNHEGVDYNGGNKNPHLAIVVVPVVVFTQENLSQEVQSTVGFAQRSDDKQWGEDVVA